MSEPQTLPQIAVVSNKARVVNDCRIHKFKLDEFVDFFISSCFVPIRKPDAGIYRKYPDVRSVAEGLGIRSILHTDYKSTRAKLALLGSPNEVRRASDF